MSTYKPQGHDLLLGFLGSKEQVFTPTCNFSNGKFPFAKKTNFRNLTNNCSIFLTRGQHIQLLTSFSGGAKLRVFLVEASMISWGRPNKPASLAMQNEGSAIFYGQNWQLSSVNQTRE